MSFKRGPVLIIMLMLIIVLGGVVMISLPTYLERKIFPGLFQDAGLHEYSLDVRRIGIAGIDLGRLTLGDAKEPWLSIASIQVDYSLIGILGRKIKSVDLSGLELNARVEDGRIVIPGLAVAKQSDSGPVGGLSLQLPVDIGSLSVRYATLVVVYKGKRLSVPFSLQIKKINDATTGQSFPVYDCELFLRPRGQLVRIVAKADSANNMIEIDYAADPLPLDVFSDLLNEIVPFSLAGKAAIHGSTAVQISPLRLIDVDADCKVYGARIAAGSFSMGNKNTGGQPETPLHIRVNGKGENMLVKVEQLTAVTPYPVHIPALVSSISYSAAAVGLDGRVQLEFAGRPTIGEPGIMTNPFREALDFNGSYDLDSHDWHIGIISSEDLHDRPVRQFDYRTESLTAEFDTVALSVAAEGSGASGRLDYTLGLAGLSVSSATVAVRAPTVSFTGHRVLGHDTGMETRLAVDFPGIQMTAGSASLIGDVSVTAMISPAGPPAATVADAGSLQSRIKLSNFIAREKGLAIRAEAIHGEIPFRWPPPLSGDRGEVIFPAIQWQQKDLGSLTTVIKQQGTGFVFEGRHENRLIKGLSLDLSGQATYAVHDAFTASCVFNTVSTNDQVEADLGFLHPALSGFFLSGRMQLEGEGGLERGTVRAHLNSRLQDATFRAAEHKLHIDGINGSLAFADLLEMRSNPQQKLRFTRAAFGDFTVEDGDIDFQLESDKSLLIEKSSCKWAGGSIYTHALRIRPGVDNYDLTVFCDQLKLASLLEQFGAARAEGDGAVSGRIPLVYAEGEIFFGDGFLYSSPGEGGTIRIAGADALAAGIPKNTPQFAQIDFAMEALKNFSYKWVKLQTKTEDENLVLAMQLDGIPDRTLPFRYDSRIGEFTRVDLQTEKGILQPIRLDVNFRLPLNSLLDYSKGIGKLIDRMK